MSLHRRFAPVTLSSIVLAVAVFSGCAAGEVVDEEASPAAAEGTTKIESLDLAEGRAAEEPADPGGDDDERGGQGVISGLWVYDHVQRFANESCRFVGTCNGSTYHGHHPHSSRALDFMIGPYAKWPSAAGNAKGDALASFALRNMRRYGIWYVIWRQRINYGDGRGWQWMADRGSITQNHYDHVHVSFWTTPNFGIPVNWPGATAYCSSYTLGRNVPAGTCVQSKTDRLWYQCSQSGVWLYAPSAWSSGSGPQGACSTRHPL